MTPVPAGQARSTSSATVVLTDSAPAAPPLIRVAAGILRDPAGRILIAQRPAGGHVGGFWEFPGGKLNPDEAPGQALVRELQEELGITVEAATPFMTYRHEYPERVVELHVFLVERYSGEPRGVEGQPLRWVALAELPTAGLLEADQPIAVALGKEPAFTRLPVLSRW
ncbi:MAG: 8-oxo-dGTP diphosphatase MutT [Gammaproteobacteria bacterium]|nr:8-oxo-dGTP diphosphatase MutT [Gammaproteobacteria bacterium]